MKLLKELKREGFTIESNTPKVTCKVFEYKSGALGRTTVHNHKARKNHLNMKLHHFRDYMTRGEDTILSIKTLGQASNYLTKAVNLRTLGRHSLTVQD